MEKIEINFVNSSGEEVLTWVPAKQVTCFMCKGTGNNLSDSLSDDCCFLCRGTKLKKVVDIENLSSQQKKDLEDYFKKNNI